MRRTRKELKTLIRELRQIVATLRDDLETEARRFELVNDRCGKTIAAINEARDILVHWRERP